MNNEQENALSAIRANAGHELLVDFDYTLFLANSSDEFIRAARPGWLCFLICCMTDAWLRWRAPGQFNQQRDFLRIRWILRILPWALPRWRKTAGKLMRSHLNQPLWNVLDNPETHPLIISYGCEEIIRPLLNELTPNMRLVASSIQQDVNLRLSSKVQAVKEVLSEDELNDAVAITDSEDDRALLDAVDKGLLVEWVRPKPYRWENVYFPFHYLQDCRYAGSNYLRGQVMLEDLPLLLCAFISISAPLHAVAAVLLYFSLLIVYEMGYFENDRVAFSRADDTTRPKRFALFKTYPIRQGWIWSVFVGLMGVAVVSDCMAGWESLFLKWVGVLVLLRIVFFIHNHIAVKERYFTYPLLSLFRYGVLFVVLSSNRVGRFLLIAQMGCQVANYLIHRTGGNILLYRRQSYRLFLFVLLIVLFGFVKSIGFYQIGALNLIGSLGVLLGLIVLKEGRTPSDIRKWIRSRSLKSMLSGTALPSGRPSVNLYPLLASEEKILEQIRSFTEPQIKHIAIWGAGKNGRVIASLIKKKYADIEVVCFLDDRADLSCVDHVTVRRAPFGLDDIDGV
ncbi:MAG: hypothetical protein PHG65_05715, partial [Kiritimatiellae bacterium]|nr:hypothetical protein [Kiritimatiellia bacterium]